MIAHHYFSSPPQAKFQNNKPKPKTEPPAQTPSYKHVCPEAVSGEAVVSCGFSLIL